MLYVGLLIVRLCFVSEFVLFIDWFYSVDLLAASVFNKLTYLLFYSIMDSCERMFEVPTLHKLVEQPDVKASASVPSTVIGVVVILIPVAVVAVAVVVNVYYRRRKNRSQSDPENVQVLKEREYVHESVFFISRCEVLRRTVLSVCFAVCFCVCVWPSFRSHSEQLCT